MAYATVQEVEAGFKELDADEKAVCTQMLEEAAVQIDSYNAEAASEKKKVVSCMMVRRAMSNAGVMPMGATQGSMGAGGYTQSWTIGSGSAGELYVSKAERRILGVGNRIGVSNPYAEGPQ